MYNTDKFPVDMIYLWCDGNEPNFFQRKRRYIKQDKNVYNAEALGQKRFYDNEELRYSLRSLELYAPWINHIFIVTDRQTPKWLNLNNPKITIIDHSEILPKTIIPCFNSSVIERYICFIPGLQEHFLYGNDDTFFGGPVSKDFFFQRGKPIVRLKYYGNDKNRYTYRELEKLLKDDFFGNSLVNAWKLLCAFNKINDIHLYEPHHNIDAFTKSDYQATFLKYKKELDKHISRFRTIDDIQRVLFSLEPVINNHAELRIIKRYSKLQKYLFLIKKVAPESYYADATFKSVFGLYCISPTLFCINGSGVSKVGNEIEKKFLELKYPNKSSFEK